MDLYDELHAVIDRFDKAAWKLPKKMTMRRIRRTKPVDMSPEAVDQRLRDLSQLYKHSCTSTVVQAGYVDPRGEVLGYGRRAER